MEIRKEVIPTDLKLQLAPLLERGYAIREYEYYPQHFGNVIIVLESDSIRVRFGRDRNVWLADIAQRSAPEEENFDSEIVLAAVGVDPTPAPPRSLAVLVDRVASFADRWEKLFSPTAYQDARRTLLEIRRKVCIEQFGYDPGNKPRS